MAARELPVACTLSGAELGTRLADLAELGRDGLLSAEAEQSRAQLRFRPDPALRPRLEAAVAAERQCCSFLELQLVHGPDATVLTIAAPPGGEPVLHELVAAFASGAA
jgi:hypothetical protein